MSNKTNVITEIIGLKALRCDLYEKKNEVERQIAQNIKRTKEQVFILERIKKEEIEEMARIAQRIDGQDVKLKEKKELKLKEEHDKIKSQLPAIKDLPPPVEKKTESEEESEEEPEKEKTDVETAEETV
jgi:hypothetical protein